MNRRDITPGFSGHIRFFDEDRLIVDKSNVVTYLASDIMAELVAGESDSRPRWLGFLYGTTPTPPSLTDPDTLVGVNRRDWTMQLLADVAEDNAANIAVAPLVGKPSVAADPASQYNQGNVVTFSAHTGMVTETLFSGASYAPPLGTLDPAYIYQIVLLARGPAQTYRPFAVSQLGNAPFVAKVPSRHQAAFWDIKFK